MLGFSSSREPVSGDMAREIREQLFRMASGASQDDSMMVSCSDGSTNYRLVKGRA